MKEQVEKIGEIADQIDNLMGAMKIPMPPNFHLEQLKSALPEISGKLKEIYVKSLGENPWE